MVEEAESPGMSVSSVARKCGIHPGQLFRWRRLVYEGALGALKAGEEVVRVSEAKPLRARIRELERLLGRKTMEVEILKEAISVAREEKLLLRKPLSRDADTPWNGSETVLCFSDIRQKRFDLTMGRS